MSAYNTGPERLNAVETRAICNVPIDSEALGDPVDPATGLVKPDVLHQNLLWVQDEVVLRLKGAEFCGLEVRTSVPLPVRCNGVCGAECTCTFGFISEEERLAMRKFYKPSEQVRAQWPDERQREEFSRLVAFLEDPTHCLRAKYSVEMRACNDPACPYGCVKRFNSPRRNHSLLGLVVITPTAASHSSGRRSLLRSQDTTKAWRNGRATWSNLLQIRTPSIGEKGRSKE